MKIGSGVQEQQKKRGAARRKIALRAILKPSTNTEKAFLGPLCVGGLVHTRVHPGVGLWRGFSPQLLP